MLRPLPHDPASHQQMRRNGFPAGIIAHSRSNDVCTLAATALTVPGNRTIFAT
jgi:hypothetical protein